MPAGRLPCFHQCLTEQSRLAVKLPQQLDGSEVVRKASSVAALQIIPECYVDACLNERRSTFIHTCKGQLKPPQPLTQQRQFAPQPIGIADKFYAQSGVPVRA